MKKIESERKHLVWLPRVDLLSKGLSKDSMKSNDFILFSPQGLMFSSLDRKAARKVEKKVSCAYQQQFNKTSNAMGKHEQKNHLRVKKTETHQLSSEVHIATSELRPL